MSKTVPGASREASSIIPTTELIIDCGYITKVLALLKNVKSEVRICAYDWRWYANEPELEIQVLNQALLRYKNSNIKIRVLVDKACTFELLSSYGLNVRKVDSSKMLHTKAICFDNTSLILGSHNLTKRAGSANYEMSLVTNATEPVLQFISYFDAMWASRG